MPGKQDPFDFPLNLNTMNSFYHHGEVGPILIPHRHHGKFDTGLVHHGSPIAAMALHNSPVNAPQQMTDYIVNMNVNLNCGLPPVNSEDEEDYDDDIVSQSGSESVSVQGSDLDLDVDIGDDVDSLVLNIRDKLRMAPQFNLHHNHLVSSHSSASTEYWTDSCSATSTPNSIHSNASTTDNNDLLILPHHQPRCSGSSANSTSSSNCNKSSTSSSRKRRGTLTSGNSNSRSSNHYWRHSHPHHGGNNSYYRQFHQAQSGSITKAKKSFHQNHWWSSKSFSDMSNKSRSKEAYHFLQELLQSGTLIQEAVRRLNRKCSSIGSTISHGSNSSNVSNAGVICSCNNSSSSNQDTTAPCSNSSCNNESNLVVSSTKFNYMDEDAEHSFTSHCHPSLTLSATCN